MAHLFELSQDLTDQALDQFDRLLGELMRKGERRQEKHFRLNARALNSHLAVLTKATEAFSDPSGQLFASVDCCYCRLEYHLSDGSIRDVSQAGRRDFRDNHCTYRAVGLGAHQPHWQVSVRATTGALVGESSTPAHERASRGRENSSGGRQLKRSADRWVMGS